MGEMIPAEVIPPGEFIRSEIKERGWTQADLAEIMDRPIGFIGRIINAKCVITADIAIELGKAFGTSADLWLNLENMYRLTRQKRASRKSRQDLR